MVRDLAASHNEERISNEPSRAPKPYARKANQGRCGILPADALTMSAHFFDPSVAAKVGDLAAAVVYQNIKFWIEKNEANEEHLHEGRYWTHTSIRALAKLFPYLTENQVRRAVDKCVSAGLLGTGNFNKTPYDRTRWYCLLDDFHFDKIENGTAEGAEPIPDRTTDRTTDRKTPPPPTGSDLFSKQKDPENQGSEIPEVAPQLPALLPQPPQDAPPPPSPDPAAAFWAAYPKAPRKTDRPKAMALFAQIVAGKHKGIPKVDAWALVRAVQAYAATNPDPQFVPLPCTWLRGARWEAHTLEPAAAASGPRPESLEDRMRRARDEAQASRDAVIAAEKARRRAGGGGFQPIGQLAAEIVRRLV